VLGTTRYMNFELSEDYCDRFWEMFSTSQGDGSGHWYKQYWSWHGLTTDGLRSCAQDALDEWWDWYATYWDKGMEWMFDASDNLDYPSTYQTGGTGVFLKFNSSNLEWGQ